MGGRYPGGGYPGGVGFPGGRGRTSRTENKIPAQTFTGQLRKIDENQLALETSDTRIISFSLARSTKYQKLSSIGALSDARNRDFQPGDHVSIEATQDDNNLYHAIRLTLEKQGTAEERARASEPADLSPVADASPSGGSVAGDDDRPRLHRAPAADDAPKAENTSGDPVDTAAASRPATTVAPGPAPRDPDDPGPPVLRRGIPRDSSRSAGQQPAQPAAGPDPGPITAENRPSVLRDSRQASPLPPAADPVIGKAREAAESFTETLPNYTVKQFTTRYITEASRGNQTSWHALDNVTADVVAEDGRESYKNILVNGKPPKDKIENTGSWSSGEFASTLQDILSPVTDADFHNKRSSRIANREAFRYDFSVEQPNSHWHVYSSAQSYRPGYTGSIWIDKETYRVLRIELSAKDMPRDFPLDTVESAVDYDFVLLGENRFLLPVHSEALSCVRGTAECSRNVIDFRNYRKFTADTTVTFDEPGR
jgi:hypothetical protein